MNSTSYEYRPLASLASVLVMLLYVDLIMSGVNMVSDLMEINLLLKAQADEFISDEQWESNDSRQSLMGLLIAVYMLPVLVVFAKWIYRASANANILSPTHMTYSAGWSIGWYFVPIMNLFRPLQVMRETWEVSSAKPGEEPASGQTPAFMQLWWALWIFSGIIGRVYSRLLWDAETIDEYLVADYLGVLDGCLAIALGLAAIVMVKRVTDAQMEHGDSPLENGTGLRCSECAELIDAFAETCPMCGADVRQSRTIPG